MAEDTDATAATMAHTYQWPLSTMLMQQPLPMPSQQPGKEFKVDSSFDDIMSLNFGKNPIVQKNEDLNNSIDYRFKFRGEDVCITLSPGALFTILHVDGNGGDTWWNEANSILYEQFKRLQSGDQEQGADPGENKKPLISEEEFRDNFAIPNVYGTRFLPWPRSTILLYKYSSNATTKYWEIPEDTWKKIYNEPSEKGEYDGHAERLMIEELENIKDYLTIQPDDNEGAYKAILSVEVILSYSPCYICSHALFEEKKKLDKKLKESKTGNEDIDTSTLQKTLFELSLTQEFDEEQEQKKEEQKEAEKIEFKITFSNFYNHLEHLKGGRQNMEGLKYLMKKKFKLDVFTNDNWEYFFNAAGKEFKIDHERHSREINDKKILKYLEELVTYETLPAAIATKAALKTMEEDLRKNELL